MSEMTRAVMAYFTAYSNRSAAALADPPEVDVEGLIEGYASAFIASSPRGVAVGERGEKLRDMIPQGFAHYRAVGGKHMRIENLDVTPLNPIHALAKVKWRFDYTNTAGRSGTIRFQNVYILSFADGSPKCFCYITPDEDAAMAEHGLH